MGVEAAEEAAEAAQQHRDPAFEFNAPQYFDFQRLNDDACSPVSDGDGYFESAKTKGGAWRQQPVTFVMQHHPP
jgi:hypothetical protein